MMETSLSGRIAERAKKQRASKRERNRAVVLALRQEIHQAMADGWPVATIWRTLQEEKKVEENPDATFEILNNPSRVLNAQQSKIKFDASN